MALYFVRHGQSRANLDRIFAGDDQDAPLVEKGCDQARQAAVTLLGAGVVRIISSPSLRTMQTSRLIAEGLGLDPDDVISDDRIAEYNLGALRGQPQCKLTSSLMETVQGAEDPDAYQARIMDFVREHANDEPPTLMVSHAGSLCIIEATRQQLDPSAFYEMPSALNAEARLLDLSWLSVA
jgi:broad specificity phosphatase PhoE